MKIKIYLDRIIAYNGDYIEFGFDNCTSLENFAYTLIPPFDFSIDGGVNINSNCQIEDSESNYYEQYGNAILDFSKTMSFS